AGPSTRRAHYSRSIGHARRGRGRQGRTCPRGGTKERPMEAPRPLRLAVGQRAALSKTITEADIRTFAALTGDHNPLHLDEAFAGRSRFGRPIAHGILVAGGLSAALGPALPGPGASYLSQTLTFLRAVYSGDTVTATV